MLYLQHCVNYPLQRSIGPLPHVCYSYILEHPPLTCMTSEACSLCYSCVSQDPNGCGGGKASTISEPFNPESSHHRCTIVNHAWYTSCTGSFIRYSTYHVPTIITVWYWSTCNAAVTIIVCSVDRVYVWLVVICIAVQFILIWRCVLVECGRCRCNRYGYRAYGRTWFLPYRLWWPTNGEWRWADARSITWWFI